MTRPLSVDQSTQSATSKFWHDAWRRTQDVDGPQLRARTGAGSARPVALDASRPSEARFSDVDVRVLSGAALLSVLIVGLAAALWMPSSCQSRPIPFAADSQSMVAISVPAGRACSVSVALGSVAVTSFKIDAQPAHGELVPRGRTGVIYIPKSNFKGEDAFAFSIEGRSEVASGTSLVRVMAAVR